MTSRKERDKMEKVEDTIGLLQKNFECPICLELMTNAVATKCDHKFCSHCILETIGNNPTAPCPLCKYPFTKRSLRYLTQWNQIITCVRKLPSAFQRDTGVGFSPAKLPLPSSPAKKACVLSGQISTNAASKGDNKANKRSNIRRGKKRPSEDNVPSVFEENSSESTAAISVKSTGNLNISAAIPTTRASKRKKTAHTPEGKENIVELKKSHNKKLVDYLKASAPAPVITGSGESKLSQPKKGNIEEEIAHKTWPSATTVPNLDESQQNDDNLITPKPDVKVKKWLQEIPESVSSVDSKAVSSVEIEGILSSVASTSLKTYSDESDNDEGLMHYQDDQESEACSQGPNKIHTIDATIPEAPSETSEERERRVFPSKSNAMLSPKPKGKTKIFKTRGAPPASPVHKNRKPLFSSTTTEEDDPYTFLLSQKTPKGKKKSRKERSKEKPVEDSNQLNLSPKVTVFEDPEEAAFKEPHSNQGNGARRSKRKKSKPSLESGSQENYAEVEAAKNMLSMAEDYDLMLSQQFRDMEHAEITKQTLNQTPTADCNARVDKDHMSSRKSKWKKVPTPPKFSTVVKGGRYRGDELALKAADDSININMAPIVEETVKKGADSESNKPKCDDERSQLQPTRTHSANTCIPESCPTKDDSVIDPSTNEIGELNTIPETEGLTEDDVKASTADNKDADSDETDSIGLSHSQIQYEEPKLELQPEDVKLKLSQLSKSTSIGTVSIISGTQRQKKAILNKALIRQEKTANQIKGIPIRSDCSVVPDTASQVTSVKSGSSNLSRRVRQRNTKGKQLPQPTHGGKQLPQPTREGKQLPKPTHEGKQLRQPTREGKQLRQPTREGKQLRQPTREGKQLPQPTHEGKQLPQPTREGKQLAQPTHEGKQLRQTTHEGKQLPQPPHERKKLSQPPHKQNALHDIPVEVAESPHSECVVGDSVNSDRHSADLSQEDVIPNTANASVTEQRDIIPLPKTNIIISQPVDIEHLPDSVVLPGDSLDCLNTIPEVETLHHEYDLSNLQKSEDVSVPTKNTPSTQNTEEPFKYDCDLKDNSKTQTGSSKSPPDPKRRKSRTVRGLASKLCDADIKSIQDSAAAQVRAHAANGPEPTIITNSDDELPDIPSTMIPNSVPETNVQSVELSGPLGPLPFDSMQIADKDDSEATVLSGSNHSVREFKKPPPRSKLLSKSSNRSSQPNSIREASQDKSVIPDSYPETLTAVDSEPSESLLKETRQVNAAAIGGANVVLVEPEDSVSKDESRICSGAELKADDDFMTSGDQPIQKVNSPITDSQAMQRVMDNIHKDMELASASKKDGSEMNCEEPSATSSPLREVSSDEESEEEAITSKATRKRRKKLDFSSDEEDVPSSGRSKLKRQSAMESDSDDEVTNTKKSIKRRSQRLKYEDEGSSDDTEDNHGDIHGNLTSSSVYSSQSEPYCSQDKLVLERDCKNIVSEMENIMKQLEENDSVQNATSSMNRRDSELDDTEDDVSLVPDTYCDKDRNRQQKNVNLAVEHAGHKEKPVTVDSDVEDEAVESVSDSDSDEDMFGPSQPQSKSESPTKTKVKPDLIIEIDGGKRNSPDTILKKDRRDANIVKDQSNSCDVIPDSIKQTPDPADVNAVMDEMYKKLPLSQLSADAPLSPTPPPPLPLRKYKSPETVRLPKECEILEEVRDKWSFPKSASRLLKSDKSHSPIKKAKRSQSVKKSPKAETTDTKINAGKGASSSPAEDNGFPLKPEWSFVTTGLSKTFHIPNVELLASKLGCEVTNRFTEKTTHVIVKPIKDGERCCLRTLKYFQGIARKCWIVSIQWAIDSLKLQTLLPMEHHEIIGDDVCDSAHYAPVRSRRAKDPLLQNYEICFLGKFTNMTTVELKSLIQWTGGKGISKPTAFSKNDTLKIILVDEAIEPQLYPKLSALQTKYQACVLQKEWLLDSIGKFETVDYEGYMILNR